MYFFILAAAAAVLYWCVCTARERRRGPAERTAPPDSAEGSLEERIRSSAAVDALGEVIDALLTVMDHPVLGGPGYLTVRFPQQPFAGAFPTVTAQFPNLEEALYRRELAREELTAAGIPEVLFSHAPVFATEGGGVVALSAEVYGVGAEIERRLPHLKERDEALRALAAALQERYPALQVRLLAGDILLSPVRSGEARP